MSKPIPIISIHKITNEKKEYHSAWRACQFGFNQAKITNVCKNLGKSHKGYFWFYLNDFSLDKLEKAKEINKIPHRKPNPPLQNKICTKCLYDKNIEEYSKQKSWCKQCYRNYSKEYRRHYPDRIKKNNSNLEYYRNYTNKKIKTDINFKLSRNLRSRLRTALKNNAKNGSAVKDLGCSIEFLKQYLESKFQPGMNWENHGLKGWHIDHIIPLCTFNLVNRQEFLKACHYTNLQPLWAIDNLSKSKRGNL